MIANINPSQQSFEESHNTLKSVHLYRVMYGRIISIGRSTYYTPR